MVLYDILKMCEPMFDPAKAKVHLARYNGNQRPLDVFLEGRFDEWQQCQTRRNFERELVVSMVQAGSPKRWLFTGLFRSLGHTEKEIPEPHYDYALERITSCEQLVGRLFLKSVYSSRQSFLYGEALADDLSVAELLPERLAIADFPGFKAVNLSKAQLDILVRDNTPAWRSALSSVKGIYLITDVRKGLLYVGKASGTEGIWGRWSAYAANSHGGNVALQKEFGIEAPEERRRDLRFAILEIADLSASPEDIDHRERHWKSVLLSRVHGYNRN